MRIPLAGLIDIAEEKTRLQKALDKLGKEIGGLKGRLEPELRRLRPRGGGDGGARRTWTRPRGGAHASAKALTRLGTDLAERSPGTRVSGGSTILSPKYNPDGIGPNRRSGSARAPSPASPCHDPSRFTPLAATLPATVPFVGPETQERRAASPSAPASAPTKASSAPRPGRRRDAGRRSRGLDVRRPREPRSESGDRRPPRRRPENSRGRRGHRRPARPSRPAARRARRRRSSPRRRLSDLRLPRRGLRRPARHRALPRRPEDPEALLASAREARASSSTSPTPTTRWAAWSPAAAPWSTR